MLCHDVLSTLLDRYMMAWFSTGIGQAIMTSANYSKLINGPVCLSFSYGLTSEAVQLAVKRSLAGGQLSTVGTWFYNDQPNYPQLSSVTVTVEVEFDQIYFVAEKPLYTMQEEMVFIDDVLVTTGSCKGGGAGNLSAVWRCFIVCGFNNSCTLY